MRRVVVVAVVLLALGGCASGGGSEGAPAYASPGAMASKVGASGCGAVDVGGTVTDAHFVVCRKDGASVRFTTAASETAADGAVKAWQFLGLVAERRGTWVVASDSQSVLDSTLAALS